jgi:acetyltransferase-like isoleucine patch superfamily enzyme
MKVQIINSLSIRNVVLGKRVRFYQTTVFSGLGKLIIGDNSSFGYKNGGFYRGNVTELQARYKDSEIIINSNVAFNNSSFICAANRIEIKTDCRIGANVTMMDFEAHGTLPKDRNIIGELGTITIGKNVWIGNNVIILKNVEIGDNSIIAAGSVVIKGKYPANCIIGGNPAKIVKNI